MFPAEQVEQEVEPPAAYSFAAHEVHEPAPAAENVPQAQLEHEEAAAANEPARQFVQPHLSTEGTDPAEQVEHDEEPVEEY
jgi:hypothetical protein